MVGKGLSPAPIPETVSGSLARRHDEVGPKMRFVNGFLNAFLPVGIYAFQQPGHVLGEGAYGLQPLLVSAYIVRGESVDLVPVLERSQRHVAA